MLLEKLDFESSKTICPNRVHNAYSNCENSSLRIGKCRVKSISKALSDN